MASAFEQKRSRNWLAGALALAAAGVAFGACATGTEVPGGDQPSGGSGGTGGSADDGGPGDAKTDGTGSGKFGDKCSNDGDCSSGVCTKLGTGGGAVSVCTTPCVSGSACPSSGYCEFVLGSGYQCVPDSGTLCAVCTDDASCGDVGARCLLAPQNDKFCARDCSWDGLCPNGFECVDADAYEGTGGGDGGAPDAGTDGGAKDAGTDAGGKDAGTDAGSDAGGKDAGADASKDSGAEDAGSGTKKGEKYCVPVNGQSCACESKRDGVERTCKKSSSQGQCPGTQKCDGKTASWSTCDAKDPAPEVCNGIDDDCNGQVDDGDPDALCKSQGGTPAHAHWACVSGQCKLGSCDAGWTNYPPGPPSAGCACALDSTEPNEQCSAAKTVGPVSDGSATPVVVTGTLSGANDSDWYQFDASDVAETTTNSYHLSIHLTAPSPNNEFVFDVIRGSNCSGTAHSAFTDYDWCVDFTSGTLGEAVCSADGDVHCGDHTSHYFVRVYRKAGATATCTQYKLSIQGAGASSTACGASDTCDPQTP